MPSINDLDPSYVQIDNLEHANLTTFQVFVGPAMFFISTNQKNPFPSHQNDPWRRLAPTSQAPTIVNRCSDSGLFCKRAV